MIKVALTDENILIRTGIRSCLEKHSVEINILFEASNGKNLLDQLSRTSELPDIILLDETPLSRCLETIAVLRERYPSISVIFFTFFYNKIVFDEIIKAGVKGFLSKKGDPLLIIQAVFAVFEGNIFAYYGNDKDLLSSFETYNNIYPKLLLTLRQKQFLEFCASEKTYKEIGSEMGISIKTIDVYRDTLFKKLNINSRTGLAIYAIKNGITY